MDLAAEITKDFEDHLKIEKVYNKVFYKYLDINGAKHVLGAKTLKFTNPEDFNDPLDCYEGLINYSYSESDVNRAIRDYVLPRIWRHKPSEKRQILEMFSSPEKFQEMQLKAILDMKKRIGICCFSEINHNILMWSHYANNHKGICIGFRLGPVQEELFGLYPVRYRDEIKVIDKSVNFGTAMYYWVLTKALDWAYEREVRAVSMKKNGIVGLDPLAVTEIYYGCNISASDKQKLNDIIKCDFAHAQKFQMEIDPGLFRLKAKLFYID